MKEGPQSTEHRVKGEGTKAEEVSTMVSRPRLKRSESGPDCGYDGQLTLLISFSESGHGCCVYMCVGEGSDEEGDRKKSEDVEIRTFGGGFFFLD